MTDGLRIGDVCWNQYTRYPSPLEAGKRAKRLGLVTHWT